MGKRKQKGVIPSKSTKKQKVMLSSNITCDPMVLNLLKEETIPLFNDVAMELAEDDPAIFVQIIDQNNLHTALALPNSPIPPGVNADRCIIDIIS